MTTQRAPTDVELVMRCRGGDAQAWDLVVERYARLVHSVPARYGLNRDEIEDIGQEVFIALAGQLHRLEDPERLPAWLITTARRLTWRAAQRVRRESPAPETDLSEVETYAGEPVGAVRVPTAQELVAGWERQRTLYAALERISKRCRDLLVALFLDPETPSYDAISIQLGAPKGSIGPTRNRCLEQLRAVLEGLGLDAGEA
jgi:RNA polymerase sigma factor (sigma-70 family)